MNPNNYKPISLLTSFLKVFENALYIRVTEHLNTNNLLVGNQFDFRKGTATEDDTVDGTKFGVNLVWLSYSAQDSTLCQLMADSKCRIQ